MQQITARVLRQAEWKPVYQYNSTVRGGKSFTVYASDRLPGLTITKEVRGTSRRVRTTTFYKFAGRTTDSPTQVVKYWNEHAKASKTRKPGEPSGRNATDRAEPAGRSDPKEP